MEEEDAQIPEDIEVEKEVEISFGRRTLRELTDYQDKRGGKAEEELRQAMRVVEREFLTTSAPGGVETVPFAFRHLYNCVAEVLENASTGDEKDKYTRCPLLLSNRSLRVSLRSVTLQRTASLRADVSGGEEVEEEEDRKQEATRRSSRKSGGTTSSRSSRSSREDLSLDPRPEWVNRLVSPHP